MKKVAIFFTSAICLLLINGAKADTLECYTIDWEGLETVVGHIDNISKSDSKDQLWNLCDSNFSKCKKHCAYRFK